MKYLEVALELAHRSDHMFRHGAVVVKNNKIISMANNEYMGLKSSTGSTVLCRNSIHAEVNALKCVKCGKKLNNATIYVARIASFGRANSKPCVRCQNVLKACGITKAVYTTPFGKETMVF